MSESNYNKPSYSDSIPRHFVDAQYVLHPYEVKAIDKIVHGVVRARAIAQKHFPTIPIAKGARKYLVSIAKSPNSPKFGEDFLQEAMDKVGKTETEYVLAAIHKDFELSMIDLDSSRNSNYHRSDLKQLHISEVSKLIADFKERVLWRGHDILGAEPGDIDTGVKGIVNYAGISTFEAGAGKNDETGSPGDGPACVANATEALVANQYYPPYDIFLTPGLYTQFTLNMNSTTHITDIERMQAMVDNNGKKLLNSINITPYLIGAAETGTTAAMLAVASKTPEGEPTVIIGE
ncbi:MAG: encapsulin, partial [Candidatus Hodarchaeales archaeon]